MMDGIWYTKLTRATRDIPQHPTRVAGDALTLRCLLFTVCQLVVKKEAQLTLRLPYDTQARLPKAEHEPDLWATTGCDLGALSAA